MRARQMSPGEELRSPASADDPGTAADGQGVVLDGRGGGRKRWVVPVIASVILVAIVAAAVGWWRGRPERGSAAEANLSAAPTVPVARKDLVARQEVDGTLGYAGSHTVVNQLSGTLTALPDEGHVVERGQTLYSVDLRPVPLLYGEVPAWRSFSDGMSDGPDVRQLEENLVALGFADESNLTVDERFTPATADAVKRWQKALGVEQTGAVELGQAVFLPEAIRVSSVEGTEGSGAQPGGPVMTATGTTRVVNVELEAAKQSQVKVGDAVEVRLPDGTTTTGVVGTVGTVARTAGQGDSAEEVIDVTVTLDDPAATGSLDQAPVRVGIVTGSRKGVLTVPVSTLLALREGGYGVRVVEHGVGRIVAVEIGLFAKGMVEVNGDGLAEGMPVEVPPS